MAFPVSSCRLSPSFRFMDNLQTEVLEIEFLSYSKGMPTIGEEDFAQVLLRYTNVEDVSGYLENMRRSIPDEKVRFYLQFPFVNITQRTRFNLQYNIIQYHQYTRKVSPYFLTMNLRSTSEFSS